MQLIIRSDIRDRDCEGSPNERRLENSEALLGDRSPEGARDRAAGPALRRRRRREAGGCGGSAGRGLRRRRRAGIQHIDVPGSRPHRAGSTRTSFGTSVFQCKGKRSQTKKARRSEEVLCSFVTSSSDQPAFASFFLFVFSCEMS